MPSLYRIAQAWADLPEAHLEATLPKVRILSIGIGEPSCFRCGLLPPVPDCTCYEPTKGDPEGLRQAWAGAGGWLERGHLQDRLWGGADDPLNLVPLCVLCHDQQPMCETREQGIAFVNSEPDFARFVPLVQHLLEITDRSVRNPGRSKALLTMIRAQRDIALAMIEVGEGKHADVVTEFSAGGSEA